ncbi:MAG: hypothetical protein FJY85_19070 [Deltaproteobacteria bacterium]|nr:hypothetical protein [Chloroflexota bacterium]MBM3302038.1 hypothetical protein [Deltaproteobacteria bacterium]
MMKVWGMLSAEDEKAGFDLVLDTDWYVVLLDHGKTIARFDPRDYTATELLIELEAVLQEIRAGSRVNH